MLGAQRLPGDRQGPIPKRFRLLDSARHAVHISEVAQRLSVNRMARPQSRFPYRNRAFHVLDAFPRLARVHAERAQIIQSERHLSRPRTALPFEDSERSAVSLFRIGIFAFGLINRARLPSCRAIASW